MPWVGLLATLTWNYTRHLRGRSTICGFFRAHVPRVLVVPLWGGLTAWILPHLIRGYPRPDQRQKPCMSDDT